MRVCDIERITAFEHRLTRAQATDVVNFPWAWVRLHRGRRAGPGAECGFRGRGLRARNHRDDDLLRSQVEAAAHEVRAVSLDLLRPAIIRDWRVQIPDATDEQLGQLADRTALYARGAELTLLAVYEGDEIAAHADRTSIASTASRSSRTS